MPEILYISLLKMDMFIHSCCSGILHRTLHHLIIQIISLNIHLHIMVDHIICFIDCIVPHLLVADLRPLRSQKVSVNSRCNPCSDHSCLDRKCSASTEWVNQYTILIPWCKHDQCRRQSFRYRCFANQFPIATLMKGYS